MEQYGEEIEYKVGAMVEIPRAALTIDVISKYSDSFFKLQT